MGTLVTGRALSAAQLAALALVVAAVIALAGTAIA
jgi:hypothetical protein